MALTIVTEPTKEPVTLQELKSHLRIDFDDDDVLLNSLIPAARTWVEGQTKRGFITQTWDHAIDYAWPYRGGVYRIDLPLNPVASVTSITYVDSAGASQTLAANQYTVVARKHGSYIVPAYDVEWPTVRWVPNAITVRFVVGASTAPKSIKQAILVLAGHYYENRETTDNAPKAVESLLSPYRGVSF